MVTLSLMFGWVWLVAGTHLHEMMVGAGAVLLATLFWLLVRRSQSSVVAYRWADVLQGWRIPWCLVCDTGAVIVVLLRDLLHLREASSYYRVCSFKCSQDDPISKGRRVLTTIYMTATPNSIVLGIDPQSNRILIHQLQPAGVPEMARALGAEP